jgi:hypothetical protein
LAGLHQSCISLWLFPFDKRLTLLVDTGVVRLFEFSKNRQSWSSKKTLKVPVVSTTEPIKEPAVFDRSFEFFSNI